jgi:MoaA/NifB/PqqE/SkfB family radical SAM enzyme
MEIPGLPILLREYNAVRRPELTGKFCHAPYISLNFHQSGAVNACCYNRNHVLGRYPENTIEEIWSSANLKMLRQALDRHDFSIGCQGCALVLEERGFLSIHARDYDHKMPPSGKLATDAPIHFEFEISNLCNLECVMCDGSFSSSIRKNREKLPPLELPYDREFVRQLRPYWKNARSASFLGGEPFLNQLYYAIWDDIAELNPRLEISIVTNTTVMNDRVRRVLSRLNPHVSMSIDSLKRETYQLIRKNAKYDAVMRNRDEFIRLGRASGRPPVVSFCPMTLNQAEIPDLVLWGLKNSIYVYFNNLWKPAELSLRSLDVGALSDLLAYYEKRMKRDLLPHVNPADPGSVATFRRFEELVTQVRSWRGRKETLQEMSS